MKRIIITAILTVICAVGSITSFVVNDLPNVGEWIKTNDSQFKSHKPPKPPKDHDGHGKYHQDNQGPKGDSLKTLA